MGMLSWITGGGDTANNVIDKVSSGLDYTFYTDQEKAEASQKKLDWTLKYLQATSPQNIARRFIAVIIVFLWAFLVLVAVIAHAFGNAEFSLFLFTTLDEIVNQPFMIIIGFYFLTHVVRGLKGD